MGGFYREGAGLSGADENVSPVRPYLADAVVRVRGALNVRLVSGAGDPCLEHRAAGAVTPGNVLACFGVRHAARGQAIPGRETVGRRVAKVAAIDHVLAMGLCDDGDSAVPDERRKSQRDAMRVHQRYKRDDVGIGGTAGGCWRWRRRQHGRSRRRSALPAREWKRGQDQERGDPREDTYEWLAHGVPVLGSSTLRATPRSASTSG